MTTLSSISLSCSKVNFFTCFKATLPKVPTLTKHVADLAATKYEAEKNPFVVGIDPFVHPASFESDLKDAFDAANGNVYSFF